MDDEMIDLMAGDARLRRRLEAFADARLSPDPAATARTRARVLATAHRQAALARADASLVVVAPDAAAPRTRRPRRPLVAARWRRAVTIVMAASLCLMLLVGTAFAAQPGGPLYGTRLWVEALTLPSEPSARAIAEIARLDERLAEAVRASQAGDEAAVAAALAAYETIVDDASARALLDGDLVASAALQAGVARNIAVLTALAGQLPDGGSAAVTRALERAITRSDEAIDAIEHGGNGGNGAGTPGGPDAATPTPKPTPNPKPTPTPKPTKEPAVKPTKAPTPEPAVEPTRTPRPDRTPPAGGRPSDPPGAQGG